VRLLVRLYRPSHPLARVAMRFAEMSGSVAPLSGLFGSAGPPEEEYCLRVVGAARDMLGMGAGSFAVAFDSSMTRATVAVVDSHGETLFVKAGDGASATAVRAEAATIEWFRSMSPRTVVVPEVLELANRGGLSLVVLSDIGVEVPPGGKPSLRSLVPFLVEMRDFGHSRCDVAEALRVAISQSSGGATHHVDRLESVADAIARRWDGWTVDMCMAHGDFVPWNLAVAEDGLHLWDWEHAHRTAPWPYDAMHFVFQTETLARGRSASSAVSRVKKALAENSVGLGMEGDEETIGLLVELYAVFRVAHDIDAGRLGLRVEELLNDAGRGL
jgi:Phosphotransferase enzyme family